MEVLIASVPPIPPPLVAGRKLTVDTVGRILRPAFGGTPGKRPPRVVLDLRAVRFVTPFAIVSLATLIEDAHRHGQAVRVLCPDAPDALMYLAVSGFFLHAGPCADLVGAGDLATRSPSTNAQTVVPLTRIEDNDDVDRVVDGVRDDICRLASEGEWFKRFRNLVVEICGNVFRHAEVEVGYVAAQRYAGGRTPFIEISIGDAGRGVVDSLSGRHPTLRDSEAGDALRIAVEEGLTSRPDPHGGNGFAGLLKVSRDRQGRFALHSNGGHVAASRGGGPLRATTGASALPGTQVMVTVDCA